MTVNFRDHLRQQIAHRYAEPKFNNIKNYNLYSKYIPYLFTNNTDYVINGCSVISPNLVNIGKTCSNTNLSCTHLNRLCSFADIDFKKIDKNIEIIRNKKVDLISIGYGGFSINVIHFMYLLGVELGETEWLNSLTIYENDNISLTNSFRIYKDMSEFFTNKNSPANKLNLLGDDKFIAKDIYTVGKRLIPPNKQLNNNIYFGAPDFQTRKQLEHLPFIFTGHSGNEVEFYSRPIVDSDLTRETYGKIDLDYFFINLIKSAEKLIEILATHNAEDLKPDTKLFTYNSELSNNDERIL